MKKRINFNASPARDWRDTRLGFVIGTDRANVLFDDDSDLISQFHISFTLCLLWVNVNCTIYL